MSNFEGLVIQGLMAAWHDPVLWAFLGLIFFISIIAIWKLPKSTAIHFLAIFLWVVAGYMGGLFTIMKMIAFSVVAIYLVIAVLRLGSR